MERTNLRLKWNNTATNDPCAVCGGRTDSQIGAEIFLEGTWALVCTDCGKKHAPQLVQIRAQASPAEAVVHACNEGEPEWGSSYTDYATCPDCGKSDGYINLGNSHYGICKEHRVSWLIGSNLFSTCKYENEEHWCRNYKMLGGYRSIPPF